MVEKRFEWSWGGFKEDLDKEKQKIGDQPEPPPVTEMALLKQLIDMMNANNRPMSYHSDGTSATETVGLSVKEIARLERDLSKFCESSGFPVNTIRIGTQRGVPTILLGLETADEAVITACQDRVRSKFELRFGNNIIAFPNQSGMNGGEGYFRDSKHMLD
jgi:hypothetical protein